MYACDEAKLKRTFHTSIIIIVRIRNIGNMKTGKNPETLIYLYNDLLLFAYLVFKMTLTKFLQYFTMLKYVNFSGISSELDRTIWWNYVASG